VVGDPYYGNADRRVFMIHDPPRGSEAGLTVPDPRTAHRTTAVLSLLVVAAYKPASIWAANFVGVPHPERLILVAAVVWLIALAGWFLAVRAGGRESTALISTFVGTLFLFNAGLLVANLGTTLTFGLCAAGTVAVTLLVSRIENHDVVLGAIVVISVFLIAGPIIDLVDSYMSSDSSSSYNQPDSLMAEFTDRPDIWLVVFDGYAGNTLYRADGSWDESPSVLPKLEGLGFNAFRSAWTSYPTSAASISSMLDITYVLEDGAVLDVSTVSDLYGVIGGENRFVRTLKRNGYATTMLESGWSGSQCGTQFDSCMASSFLDEAMFKFAEQTILRDVTLDLWGHAFTAGSRGTMSWMLDNASRLNDNGTADFVFAHVMSPHPPLLLDRRCELREDVDSISLAFIAPDTTLDEQVDGYRQQVACLDKFMLEFARLVDDESVVVYVSDHGTDRRDQVPKEPSEWTREDLEERMNVLLAMRFPGSCALAEGLVTPSVFHRVLACLDPDLVTRGTFAITRMFVYSSLSSGPNIVVELPNATTEMLTGSTD
jgi:hypothetical protein